MIRTILRWLLGLVYIFVGYIHLSDPGTFLQVMPAWVPYPEAVVYWTGLAEAAGGVALIQPFGPLLRKAGGIGLALYALCVWPANINHMLLDLASEDGGMGMIYHGPRMLLQPVMIWLALWTSHVIDWPFKRRS